MKTSQSSNWNKRNKAKKVTVGTNYKLEQVSTLKKLFTNEDKIKAVKDYLKLHKIILIKYFIPTYSTDFLL